MTDHPHRHLKAGVIGLGSMGRNHVRILRELPEVQLAAVCDANPQTVSSLTLDDDCRTYRKDQRMLAEEELDMVVVAVPTRLHREVAVTAIQRGIHVLVEKPIAPSVEDGLAIREAAEASGVKLAVGHIERFNPAVVELKRRLRSGDLGRIWQVQATRVNPFPQRVRDVGVVHDLASHDIDIMRLLLGAEVERLSAEVRRGINTPYEDMFSGMLRFEDGTIGTLDINWLSPVKVRRLALLGEKGLFTLDYVSQELRFSQHDPTDPSQALATDIPVVKAEPLKQELVSFVSIILNDEEPAVGATDALAALYLCDRLAEAAAAGQTLYLSAHMGDIIQRRAP